MGVRNYLASCAANSYDIVVAAGLLHCFVDPVTIVLEMCRVAKVLGVCVERESKRARARERMSDSARERESKKARERMSEIHREKDGERKRDTRTHAQTDAYAMCTPQVALVLEVDQPEVYMNGGISDGDHDRHTF